VLLWQTWAQGCSQRTPSTVLPRWYSIPKVDLSSSVNPLESSGNPTLHSHLSLSSPPVFPHDLPFGDTISHLKEDDNIFRIGFCNINGFPASPPPNDKAQELKTFMALYDLNLFGGSKLNLNWSKLPDNLWLSEWFCNVPSCCMFTTHNSNENITCHQFGSTFWIGIGQATQYITGLIKNPSGLGHWSTCTLLSRSRKCLHMIFGYRPCQNLCSHLWSVYAQHHHYFDFIDRYICPWAAFLLDLAQAITKWTQLGDKILLLADLNEISNNKRFLPLQHCVAWLKLFYLTSHLYPLLLSLKEAIIWDIHQYPPGHDVCHPA